MYFDQTLKGLHTANTLSRNEKCIPQKWNALMLNHCIYYVCLFLTLILSVYILIPSFIFPSDSHQLSSRSL